MKTLLLAAATILAAPAAMACPDGSLQETTNLMVSIGQHGDGVDPAEATAAITKVFSGAISDHLGSRKSLAALGYGLAAGGSACAPWPQPARVEQANGFAHQRRAAVGPIPVH